MPLDLSAAALPERLQDLSTRDLQALRDAVASALTRSHERDLAAALRPGPGSGPTALTVTFTVFEGDGDPFYDPGDATWHLADGSTRTAALSPAAEQALAALSDLHEPNHDDVLRVDLTPATTRS
ncbi:hypothetical protein [Streptacidiphilus sp. EB103A]|uniref:hypothetical protein n=1 Tax=Streptacidiphilus sp. EB103A TaxID=3156275 RepID=UPI0035188E70